MKQSALAQVLNQTGVLTPVNIYTNASGDSGWVNVKIIRLYYFQEENLLEIETSSGQRVYLDGDFIEAIMVVK